MYMCNDYVLYTSGMYKLMPLQFTETNIPLPRLWCVLTILIYINSCLQNNLQIVILKRKFLVLIKKRNLRSVKKTVNVAMFCIFDTWQALPDL